LALFPPHPGRLGQSPWVSHPPPPHPGRLDPGAEGQVKLSPFPLVHAQPGTYSGYLWPLGCTGSLGRNGWGLLGEGVVGNWWYIGILFGRLAAVFAQAK
jgi:hypothetical protein